MKGRIGHIDLASGILIIWIMSFHAMNNAKVFGETDARVALPYLVFSLPWFFYKSGQFFKPSGGLSGVWHDCRKFLLPFVIWTSIGYLFYLAMMAIDAEPFTYKTCVAKPLETFYIYGYVPINVPLWFLLSLLAVKLISRLLLSLKIHPVICIILGLGIPYALHLWNNPAIPVYCANIPMGMAFFMLGYSIGKYEKNLWLPITCAAVFILLLTYKAPIVGLHRNIHLAGEYLLWPVFGYCGTVAFNGLCRIIRSALDGIGLSKFRPIGFLGQKSMQLLTTHALIYMPVIHYSHLMPLSPIWVFCLIEALYFMVLLPLIILCGKR